MLAKDHDITMVEYTSVKPARRRRPLNQTGGQTGRQPIVLFDAAEVVGAHGVLIARPAPNCLPACSNSLLRTSEKKTGAVRRHPARRLYARRGRRGPCM